MEKTIEWLDTKAKNVIEVMLTYCEKGKVSYPVFAHTISSTDETKQQMKWNADTIDHGIKKYKEILFKINLEVSVAPSVESFCSFLGWNARKYKELLNASNSDIYPSMTMINDYILDCQLSMAQNGQIKGNMTQFRAQVAGEHGAGLMTQREKPTDRTGGVELKTKEYYEQKLANLTISHIEVEEKE